MSARPVACGCLDAHISVSCPRFYNRAFVLTRIERAVSVRGIHLRRRLDPHCDSDRNHHCGISDT